MLDIKKIYEQTKYAKTQSNIKEYEKAINEYLESPYEYISNIEYIITSSIGIKSFREFLSRYDISICSYDYLLEKFNKCIDKCKKNKLDDSIYKEYYKLLSNLKNDNMKFVVMYEYFSYDMDKYLKIFYGITENTYNSRNIDGMIKTFNEEAVPDMLVIANKVNKKSIPTILRYVKEQSRFNYPLFYEWMTFVCEDFNIPRNESVRYFKEHSLSPIISKIINNKNKLFREALLSNEKNIQIRYTSNDINAMHNMVQFNEFLSLYADEIYKENAKEIKSNIKKQNNLLYEELIAMEDVSFLDEIDEAMIFDKHIQHKKTGMTPKYLNNIYGNSDTYEIDNKSQKDNTEEINDDEEPDEDSDNIESYRRPSSNMKPIKKSYSPTTHDDNDIQNTSVGLGLKNKLNDSSIPNQNSSNVYNTYYYNYTNSYNRNSNSYNHRREDNHHNTSVNNKMPDQSLNIRSNKENQNESSDPLSELEPWRLDINPTRKIYIENIFSNENSNTCKLWHLPEKVSNEIKQMNLSILESIHNEIENGNYDEIEKLKLEKYFDIITSKGYLFEVGDTAILEKDNKIYGYITILPNVNSEFNISKLYTYESSLGNNFKSTLNITRLNVSDDTNIKFRNKLNNIIENAINNYYGESNSKDNNINLAIFGSDTNIKYIYGVLSESYSKKILNYLREKELNDSEEIEDPEMPQSDHPIRDTLIDIDRNLTSYQQSAKKAAQSVINVGKVAAKPIKRVSNWLTGLVNFWKDKDEEDIKEDLADPENRYNLYRAARTGIHYWALGYAGLLLNPIFIYLGLSKLWTRTMKQDRIRNEMINEINTELKIIDDKINYADKNNDLKNKYKLMRYKNEIQKKLLKVAGKDVQLGS